MPDEFSELTRELNRIASKITVRKGTPLFRSGDPVAGAYLVRSGAIRMTLPTPHVLYPPKILGPGEIAGLPGTLTGTYSLSADVIEDAELGFIPTPRVTHVLEVSPRLCIIAMRLISQEIARTRNCLKDAPVLKDTDDAADEAEGAPPD
ncbi:MAG TPA: Crp/Fnr family transcriptional regulator [Acidobacteriaceae bacterium]|jgi:CRP/FNR family transcriptional regulator|nr:Crp/Fnr family transcriptional regulator [Acidobacteriaceae bacterium]